MLYLYVVIATRQTLNRCVQYCTLLYDIVSSLEAFIVNSENVLRVHWEIFCDPLSPLSRWGYFIVMNYL